MRDMWEEWEEYFQGVSVEPAVREETRNIAALAAEKMRPAELH